jgi:hypothetical protein
MSVSFDFDRAAEKSRLACEAGEILRRLLDHSERSDDTKAKTAEESFVEFLPGRSGMPPGMHDFGCSMTAFVRRRGEDGTLCGIAKVG